MKGEQTMSFNRNTFEVTISATGEVKEIVSYRTVGQANGFDKKLKRDEVQRDYETMAGRNFSFFNAASIQHYIHLGDEEHLKVFGAVMLLATYLPMDGTGKLPQATQKEMAKVLGISERHMSDVISKAQQLDLIHKMNDGYYMNTDVIHRGTLKESTGTVKSFHKVMRALKNTMGLQHIGFLFLILPYISFDHHIICKNPNEAELEHIKGMTNEELGKAVGLNKTTIGRKINSMTFDYESMTMSVFAYFINPVSGKKLIIVNPALFSRTTSNNWKNIINLFIISK
jgi:DNA-binding XRE family transcriptional regulator